MLQSQEDTEKQQIAEFVKLRDEAEAEKENSKNNYWWCLLGPAACAVVAIEQKVSSANAKIDALSGQIKKTSTELSLVTGTWQLVNKFGKFFNHQY